MLHCPDALSCIFERLSLKHTALLAQTCKRLRAQARTHELEVTFAAVKLQRFWASRDSVFALARRFAALRVEDHVTSFGGLCEFILRPDVMQVHNALFRRLFRLATRKLRDDAELPRKCVVFLVAYPFAHFSRGFLPSGPVRTALVRASCEYLARFERLVGEPVMTETDARQFLRSAGTFYERRVSWREEEICRSLRRICERIYENPGDQALMDELDRLSLRLLEECGQEAVDRFFETL